MYCHIISEYSVLSSRLVNHDLHVASKAHSAFSALTLLATRPEEHPVCKN